MPTLNFHSQDAIQSVGHLDLGLALRGFEHIKIKELETRGFELLKDLETRGFELLKELEIRGFELIQELEKNVLLRFVSGGCDSLVKIWREGEDGR